MDFLLLHGMNVGAYEWERVIPALQADARTGKVIAPDLPGRGPGRPRDLDSVRLRDYYATALAAIRDNDLRELVLVGHSAGGTTLQALAAAEPERVRRLVFLCAAIPRNGKALTDWYPAPWRLFVKGWLRLRCRQSGIVPNKRLARWALCNGIDAGECDRLVQQLVPEPRHLLIDPIGWKSDAVRVPATYILTTQDRIIRPKDQERMARTVPGIQIVRLPMGHAGPVIYPDRLVQILLAGGSANPAGRSAR